METSSTRTINVLQDALLRRLGDEVELIFRYGSQIKGGTHRYSDLDISYVPVHESTWTSITVLVDDTLIDLYPLHWSQLERFARFDDVRCTVLLAHQLIYQQSDAAAARFHGLAAQLRTLLQPDALPAMHTKAQSIFQSTGYPLYLLRQQATDGHLPSCFLHAQRILALVFHCLAVYNQAPIDTRKTAQVLALPKLPVQFADIVERVIRAHSPDVLLATCESLLTTTRAFLLAEQRRLPRRTTTFPAVFAAAYPEFKGDLQHVLLACERQDLFSLKEKLLSVYHEVMVHLTQAVTGIDYSDFNSLADYEQPLVALGFPDLWPYVVAQDFAGLHQQCQLFDRHLQTFLTDHAVALNAFATVDELEAFLAPPAMPS